MELADMLACEARFWECKSPQTPLKERKMKLSAMELILIIDTLNGSLCIQNGTGRLFMFDENQRKAIKSKLEDIMNEMNVSVEIDKNTGG